MNPLRPLVRLGTLVLLLLGTPLCAEISFRLAGWNMEGNGNDIDPARLKAQLGAKEGVDLWGLSEVRPELFDEFEAGAEIGESSDFETVRGTTGDNIRLAIVFDKTVLERLDTFELSDPSFSGFRHSLVGRFRGRRTGQEFLFVVNHLARGQASARLRQAKFLNSWARTNTLPIIAVGDFNFDFDINRGDFGDRDPGFDAMIRDGVFEWLRPRTLVKTQADDRFNTVLDFVFVANEEPLREAGWTAVPRILEREGDVVATTVDFADSRQDSDHRPVDAVFAIPTDPPVDPDRGTIDALIVRLQALEREAASIREALNALRR